MSGYISRLFGFVFNIFRKQKSPTPEDLELEVPELPTLPNAEDHNESSTPMEIEPEPQKLADTPNGEAGINLVNQEIKDDAQKEQSSRGVKLRRSNSLPVKRPGSFRPLRRRSHSPLLEYRELDGTAEDTQVERNVCGTRLNQSFLDKSCQRPPICHLRSISIPEESEFVEDSAVKSCHSFETSSIADEWMTTAEYTIDPSDIDCGRRPKRLHQPRIQHFPKSGIPTYLNNSSHVPSTKTPKQGSDKMLSKQFTKFTVKKRINECGICPVKEDQIGDSFRHENEDVGNWINYRRETSMKFENVFKMLSKKKHVIGNQIDSATHAHWMHYSGIHVDEDASHFKSFAGGKVVLNFGEYKYMIARICSSRDLDYWDVLRKMATFPEDGE